MTARRIRSARTPRASSRSDLTRLPCALFHGPRAVDLAEGDARPMPFKQEILAAASGRTAVQVSRTLQALRAEEMVILENRRPTIPSLAAIEAAAGSCPAYRHLAREGAHLDAQAGEL